MAQSVSPAILSESSCSHGYKLAVVQACLVLAGEVSGLGLFLVMFSREDVADMNFFSGRIRRCLGTLALWISPWLQRDLLGPYSL